MAEKAVHMRGHRFVDQKPIVQIRELAAQLERSILIVQLIDGNDGDGALHLFGAQQLLVMLDGGLMIELAAALQVLDEHADIGVGRLQRVRQQTIFRLCVVCFFQDFTGFGFCVADMCAFSSVLRTRAFALYRRSENARNVFIYLWFYHIFFWIHYGFGVRFVCFARAQPIDKYIF